MLPSFFREATEYFSKSMLNDKLHLQQHGFVVENIRPIIKQKEEDTGMLSSKIPVSDCGRISVFHFLSFIFLNIWKTNILNIRFFSCYSINKDEGDNQLSNADLTQL